MLQTTVLTITFEHQGKPVTRNIDKIKFIFDTYDYTIYRLQGKTCNFDLLKCGKWWQVDVVEQLPVVLLEKIGEAIDKVDGD